MKKVHTSPKPDILKFWRSLYFGISQTKISNDHIILYCILFVPTGVWGLHLMIIWYKISSLYQSQGYDLDEELEKHKKIEAQKIKAEIKLGKEENVHRGFFKQYKTMMFEKDGKESTVDVVDIRVKN